MTLKDDLTLTQLLGFQSTGLPLLEGDLILSVLPHSPVIIIILVIEHIAIAKSFGKRFSYSVIPSQEIIAQSGANILGPFFGGYSCTGSFGASAVLSKAGVKTPLAGLFSAMVLVLALYALTSVFYYIPNAALAGLIVHATANLVASPGTLKRYWRLSPLELLIWIAGVLIAVFVNLETSIYTTIGVSMGLFLIRVARTRGSVLGSVRIWDHDQSTGSEKHKDESKPHAAFIPLGSDDPHNPNISVQVPYPGLFVYRFAEGLNFLNASQQLNQLGKHIRSATRAGSSTDSVPQHSMLWSDASSGTKDASIEARKPVLCSVVFDCASVNSIDVTSIEALVDLRNSLEGYAHPYRVDWHFASVTNRWSRRALATVGFGIPSTAEAENCRRRGVYVMASTLAGASDDDLRAEIKRRTRAVDNEARSVELKSGSEQGTVTRESLSPRLHPVYGLNRPYFHMDLVQSVSSAIKIVKERE